MSYKSRNVYCEGYIPKGLDFIDKVDLDLRFNDTSLDDNIKIDFDNLAQATVNKNNLAFDLIRISVYIYIADCRTKRGTNSDPFDENWNVDLNFYIPVLEADFWNRTDVKNLLSKGLNFAVGHRYNFEFVKWQPKYRKLFLDIFDKKTQQLDIDCISMFSGGLDSLYSTILLLEEKRKPLLISHKATHKLSGFRKDLYESLKKDYQSDLKKWEILISNKKESGIEKTQRSRSFVYACLGVAFAKCLNLKDVFLSDNGIVTFNLKSTLQNIGTLNTRSTNPKLIEYVNKLSKLLWEDNAPIVENKLLWKTKADVVKGLKDLNQSKLLSMSTSCVSTYGLSLVQPYCGICSQCVDRRFAVEWNNISEDDEPRSHYQFDIFKADLNEQIDKGIGKSHAENYYRKAKFIDNANDMQFMDFYNEIYDFIPEETDENEFLKNTYDLHKRYSEQTFSVIGNYGKDYARGKFPENSLITMIYREGNKKEEINNYILPERKDLIIDKRKRYVEYKGNEIDLTTFEFKFLLKIVSEPTAYIRYEELFTGEDLEADYNPNAKDTYSTPANTHKSNINKKFKQACKFINLPKGFSVFETKQNYGYRLYPSLVDKLEIK